METIEFSVENHDYIANLQLIEGVPNQEKSNKDFETWLDNHCSTSEEKMEYKRRHLIPSMDLKLENFDEFMTEREDIIKKRLTDLLV